MEQEFTRRTAALASRIDYHPTLPPLRERLTQRAPPGTLMKFDAVYPAPFWRSQGLSGQVVSEQAPVKVTLDTSPRDGSLGIMMGFVGGHEAPGCRLHRASCA